MSWNDHLKSQFADRQSLTKTDLIREFGLRGANAHKTIEECLGLFQQEYGIPVGLLRANDSLQLFTQPPKTKNPITWFFMRAAYEDSTSELDYRLGKRLRVTKRSLDKPPTTVGEYVATWVGEPSV